MAMTEDEFFEKYARQCLKCMPNTLYPNENEWICTSR